MHRPRLHRPPFAKNETVGRKNTRSDHYAPEFQTDNPQQPHRGDIRDDDGRARVVQLLPGGETELLSSEVRRAIVLRDRVGGGLELSKAVADNLDRYTQALLEVDRSSGQRSERERLLREDTASSLHR